MPRRKKDQENLTENTTTVKKTSRKKKAEVTEAAAEAVTEVSAPAETAPVKKRGRKPKNPATIAENAAASPAPKKRGRKKAAPAMTAEAAPPVEAETAFADSAPVDLTPQMVVDIAEAAEAVEAPPAKKPRKPRTPKADRKETAAEPKKRGRKPKESGPVISTILQIGDAEFDITDIAQKAYKDYKRVHKRKVVTDFRIYVKPEENAAYFTVNGEGAEEYKVDLS